MNTEPMGVNDALSLGKPKFALLGVQHLFAMFGATVLVPIITGLSVSATLLFAGIGTLIGSGPKGGSSSFMADAKPIESA